MFNIRDLVSSFLDRHAAWARADQDEGVGGQAWNSAAPSEVGPFSFSGRPGNPFSGGVMDAIRNLEDGFEPWQGGSSFVPSSTTSSTAGGMRPMTSRTPRSSL